MLCRPTAVCICTLLIRDENSQEGIIIVKLQQLPQSRSLREMREYGSLRHRAVEVH